MTYELQTAEQARASSMLNHSREQFLRTAQSAIVEAAGRAETNCEFRFYTNDHLRGQMIIYLQSLGYRVATFRVDRCRWALSW
jgi:hypothetical protein